MDRGAWQATVQEVTRGRHDLMTKSPRVIKIKYNTLCYLGLIKTLLISCKKITGHDADSR